MGGDRRATMGNLISSRDIETVYPADSYSVIGIAGAAGIAIEMVRLYQVELEHYEKIEGLTLSLDGKANRLVVAPVAEPALVGPEVTGRHGPLDRRPDRLQGALEAHQLALVGGVGERVAVAEVEQLQLAGDDAAGTPEHQRVELHLEQRLRLEGLPRHRPGLVVDDPERTVGR